MKQGAVALVLGLAVVVASARGAGDERFRGGSRDGYAGARRLSVPAAARMAWYGGGAGDGNGAARWLQVAEFLQQGWYLGARGDGFSRSEYRGNPPELRSVWFRGGPRDGAARAGVRGLPNPLDRDTDVDGLPDWWELAAGRSLTGVEPMGDLDEDQFPNLHEYWAGTSGTEPGSLLQVEDVTWTDEHVVITWQSAAGRSYSLERATNLVVGPWLMVATNIGASQPMNSRTDTSAAGSGPWHYRIRLE